MRDMGKIDFGGKEYPLLPTFRVMSDFEDRYGAVADHFLALTGATAKIKPRAYLLFLGLQAARDAAPVEGRSFGFTPERVEEAMFDRGAWHETTVAAEIDFVQSLMFTPEQFAEKKAARTAALKTREAMDKAVAALSSFSPSPAQT